MDEPAPGSVSCKVGSDIDESDLEAHLLLQFEKDVALSATRQLALREGARLRTESAMEARAREVMEHMQAEQGRLRAQLKILREGSCLALSEDKEEHGHNRIEGQQGRFSLRVKGLQ